jgi:hypothetical protein
MQREILKFCVFVAFIILAELAAASLPHLRGSTESAANCFERLDGCQGGASFAWGEHTLARTVDTQVTFIRRTATKVQREIAERNARAYMAQLTEQKRTELKKRKVRYLAVPTVRSKETSPEAKEVLMIWDIPRESLVGKNVYEVNNPPPVGGLATYDNLVAEYVGKPAK